MSAMVAALCSRLLGVFATIQFSLGGKCRRARDRARTVTFQKPFGEDPDEMGKRPPLVIRALSGEVLLEKEGAAPSTPISKIIEDLCAKTGAQKDTVQLCAGAEVLKHSSRLKDCFPDSFGKVGEAGDANEEDSRPLELTVMRLSGPPVTARATSGREIKLLDAVPPRGSRCHLDRNYRFVSLGGFAGREGMRYLFTCNDDKRMPVREVMWRLEVNVPVVVYLNFRSDVHVTHTGAREWLQEGGWQVNNDMQSTVSTGIPNGPYQGPIYSKAVDSGGVDLMGSNCSEGTYFVFVDVGM